MSPKRQSSAVDSPTTKQIANGEYFPPFPHGSVSPPSRHKPDRGVSSRGSLVNGNSGGDGQSELFAPHNRRGKGKGMTLEEVHAGHIISEEERSLEFEGLPIGEEEIKHLPKKLRPYYQQLAVLADHYKEVDSLLSGSLPQDIAMSFSPQQGYMHQHGDIDHGGAWGRRTSAWKIAQSRSAQQQEPGDEEEPSEHTGLLSHLREGQGGSKEERRENLARLALNVNTIVNILLVAAKVVAVLYSASISLTASLVDSALDLLSTMIILGTSWAIGVKTDKHKYPAGKRRFEPLGVLIFSVAMIASFVQVFIESFQRAIGAAEEAVDLSWIGIGVMLATIFLKAILWVWCSRIPSSGVQALAQDAENDVFFNIMSLAFPWFGSLLHWRLLDPIGGMVLSLYIIFEWIKTLLQNFANLSGKSASRDQITRVLYLVTRFNPVIEIADVECYHIGDDLIVEIDVILPRSSSLHFAHDVGETIQCVIESLDGVLRAYVHCDYSSSNPSQHTARQPQALPSQSRQASESSSDSATPRPPKTILSHRQESQASIQAGLPVESPSTM
ncbi:hypothetical protein IAU60_003665 [Kwoniella sp. DSM 27419]